jgi:hypothetical protein
MSILDDSAFCEPCKQFQDIDLVFSEAGDHRFNHHKSYTALCRSAKDGCPLCQLIKYSHETTGWAWPKDSLREEFDQDLPVSRTQITLTARSAGTFIFRQENLSHWKPPYQLINIWVDLYTTSGEI